jgi:phosphatidylserine decarboxylase
MEEAAMNAFREDARSVGEVGSHHVGGWLPADRAALEAWLVGLKSTVETREPRELHPVIVEFQELIATDPVVRMYLTEMIAEVPKRKK